MADAPVYCVTCDVKRLGKGVWAQHDVTFYANASLCVRARLMLLVRAHYVCVCVRAIE